MNKSTPCACEYINNMVPLKGSNGLQSEARITLSVNKKYFKWQKCNAVIKLFGHSIHCNTSAMLCLTGIQSRRLCSPFIPSRKGEDYSNSLQELHCKFLKAA